MKIEEITSLNPEIIDQIQNFVRQLTSDEDKTDTNLINDLISHNNSHLFFAIDDNGKYTGMLTLGFYISPTGKKAWVEDVVVDESQRGKGIGRFLMEFAINYSKEHKAKILMLTSRPARVSANILYQKIGFRQKITNVYVMDL